MTNMESNSMELVVPGVGQLVNLDSPREVAFAIDAVRDLERQLRGVKAELTAALVYACEVEGTKTLYFEGGKAVVKSGPETTYDAEAIEDGLRAAGMPEHRIREVVKETVSYTVVAGEAKKAASANPAYAKVLEANRQVAVKSPYVTVSLA